MSAPKIDGQVFADYEFAEYPKVIYAGGDLTGESRTVADAAEEAAAREDGFSDGANEPHVEAEAGDETTAAVESNDTLTGGEGSDAL